MFFLFFLLIFISTQSYRQIKQVNLLHFYAAFQSKILLLFVITKLEFRIIQVLLFPSPLFYLNFLALTIYEQSSAPYCF